ncbi:hypothetical protein TTHERM_000467639 (macronuclear) [Tetrahymena thermophila SB210]|uniref:Transmembrane protein n=1 Tax=Tetrahymena thermophila (strain SB210) TaxID=312017 RepID=W7X5X0_TETTS|nr:hypothetical protein TTHERM_000467639 [Tetrahymena thermophila SB210]EWS71758.1 hypothetical protein TTHERM_000467639 [Tetrahymena thermophila SB210]|eukprot:XP_012655711.1 hypothetical protein TTHERM_000467639 [Tetrahymena thermophila SB210]
MLFQIIQSSKLKILLNFLVNKLFLQIASKLVEGEEEEQQQQNNQEKLKILNQLSLQSIIATCKLQQFQHQN